MFTNITIIKIFFNNFINYYFIKNFSFLIFFNIKSYITFINHIRLKYYYSYITRLNINVIYVIININHIKAYEITTIKFIIL